MSNHHHPPEDRDWHEYQDWLETHDYAVINNAIALIRAHCKSHHYWVCDRLLEVRHRAAYAETRLAELAAKEETYSSHVNRDARNAWIPPPAYARTKTCRARDARSTGETPMTNDQRERLLCCRCRRDMNEVQSMRPIDPKGTAGRRWVCNRCEGFYYLTQEQAILAAIRGEELADD